jgi:hypothetical protein
MFSEYDLQHLQYENLSISTLHIWAVCDKFVRLYIPYCLVTVVTVNVEFSDVINCSFLQWTRVRYLADLCNKQPVGVFITTKTQREANQCCLRSVCTILS